MPGTSSDQDEKPPMPAPGKPDGRYQIDWLISNLRWLLLISVALIISLDALTSYGGSLDFSHFLPQIALFVIAVFYNLGVMLLLAYSSYSHIVPVMSLVIDTALSVGFIVTSGGLQSQFFFFTLFPILTAALRFQWEISLLVAVAVIVSAGFASYALAPFAFAASLVSFAAISLVLLLAALVSGLVGDRMKRIIARRQAVEREREQRQLHAAREHTRLTFELASTLSATLNYDKVLQAMLEVGEKGLRELSNGQIKQIGVVMLFSRNHLRIVASRHLPVRDRNLVFDSKKGILSEALNTAEPVLTDDPISDPELGRLIAMHQCKQAIVVPLRAGFESFGVVVFGSSRPDTYDEDLQDMLMAISNQAIVALQNAQLYQDLREEKERIVAVEEDARKKLARDLHDGPTQTIASIAMKVNYARMLLREQSDVDKATEELEQVEDLARHTTKEIRHMLFTLRPLILETQGLRAALEQYISKMQETKDLPVHLESKPDVDDLLSRDDQGVLFYIIEEAIGNARKHAQPDNVWVRLYLEDEQTLVAEVEDDGEGFDVETVQASYDQRGSLGLVNMHERAEMLDGEVSISSAPGEGTKITLSIPLDRR